jgi:hypothetical protein
LVFGTHTMVRKRYASGPRPAPCAARGVILRDIGAREDVVTIRRVLIVLGAALLAGLPVTAAYADPPARTRCDLPPTKIIRIARRRSNAWTSNGSGR